MKSAKKENNYILELDKKKEEFRLKYENYKKLALKEKDEKDAKIKEFELLKKERADKQTANPDKKKENDSDQAGPSVQDKYENLKIMYNKQQKKLEIADRNSKDLEIKNKNIENMLTELKNEKQLLHQSQDDLFAQIDSIFESNS